jgi:tetratricopeptide (TPR) repeat protein
MKRIRCVIISLFLFGSNLGGENKETFFSPEALHRQAQVYLISGKFTEALKTWNNLLARYPNSPFTAEAYLSQARILLLKKKFKKARSIFKKLPAQSPFYPEALLGIGSAYLKEAKYHEAITWFARALEYSPFPTHHLLLYSLGEAYQKIGAVEKARAVWEELIKEYPSSLEANKVKAKIKHLLQVSLIKIYSFQVGAFKDKKNAVKFLREVEKKHSQARVVKGKLYKVKVGWSLNKEALSEEIQALKKKLLLTPFITSEYALRCGEFKSKETIHLIEKELKKKYPEKLIIPAEETIYIIGFRNIEEAKKFGEELWKN